MPRRHTHAHTHTHTNLCDFLKIHNANRYSQTTAYFYSFTISTTVFYCFFNGEHVCLCICEPKWVFSLQPAINFWNPGTVAVLSELSNRAEDNILSCAQYMDFLAGPVVKNLCFYCRRDMGSTPGWGTKIPLAA